MGDSDHLRQPTDSGAGMAAFASRGKRLRWWLDGGAWAPSRMQATLWGFWEPPLVATPLVGATRPPESPDMDEPRVSLEALAAWHIRPCRGSDGEEKRCA